MSVACSLVLTAGIKEGQVVKRTKRIASIRVNDNMLGRVINPLGQAVDGMGDIDLTDSFEMPLDRKAHWCDISSAREGTSPDGSEGYRLHDSYRTWTA